MQRIPTQLHRLLAALVVSIPLLGGCMDRPDVEEAASDAAADVQADHGVLFAPSFEMAPVPGPDLLELAERIEVPALEPAVVETLPAPVDEAAEAAPSAGAEVAEVEATPEPRDGILPAGLLEDLPMPGADDAAEPDADEALDPTLLQRAAACARPERDEDLDCDLPVAPSTVAYHPGTQRVAMLWSPVVSGGADCSDVYGLILRASDGKAVATRTLEDTAACEEELEYEVQGLATWRWLSFLNKRGYVDVDDAVVDTIGPWGADEGAAALLSGPLSGWVVFVEPSEDEVRVLLVAPGNQVAFELHREAIEDVSCWEPEDFDEEVDEEAAEELEDMDCSLRYPHLEDVVLSPDGRHLVVAYGMTGASCHSDSEYTRIIASLPGVAVSS